MLAEGSGQNKGTRGGVELKEKLGWWKVHPTSGVRFVGRRISLQRRFSKPNYFVERG